MGPASGLVPVGRVGVWADSMLDPMWDRVIWLVGLPTGMAPWARFGLWAGD